MKLDTWRQVEAPEGVELELRVAGPLPRASAWALDLLMRVFVHSTVGGALQVFGGVGLALAVIFAFLVEWGWSIGFEVFHSGATPGKKLVGIQVVQDDGAPVGWTQSSLRNLLRLADMLPFGYVFGLISCFADEDFKRLGDRVAGTVVVHVDPETKLPPLGKAEPCPLPILLTLEEQAALVDFAARAPLWTSARRVEVADQAEALTRLTGVEGVRRLFGMAHWIQGAR